MPLNNSVMDWDKLRIFHAVADAGSFTHAGHELGLSQSAVSRQISALEDALNVPLFHRHARGLILTEQGEMLYRTAHEVFTKLTAAQTRLMDSKEKPSGELRITTTVGLGSVWLTPRLKEFSEIYPEINVTLLLDDRELWRMLQDWLIDTLCQPVFEAWLEMAVLSGTLQLPAYETAPEVYEDIRWAPRGWRWIDPAKEGSAAKSDVRAGFSTLTDVLAEQGEDIEEHFRRRRDEIALAKRYGLVLDTDPSQVTDKGQAQADPNAAAAGGAAKPTEPDNPSTPSGGETDDN